MTGRIAIALLTTCLFAASPAAAAPASPTGTSVRDGLSGDARVKFDDASRLYRDKRYAEAREAFLGALGSSGDSRILFNVAVCDKALGRYARAIASLKRSLVVTGRELPADYTQKVDDAITTLSRYVSFVKLESAVEGVAFMVDGEPVRDNPVALDPGTHVVTATKESYEPASTTLTVKAGEPEQVKLDPRPLATPGVAKVSCPGAVRCEIRVGDEVLGNAPVSFTRSKGSYLVRARVDGREWSEQRVEIENGKSIEVAMVGRALPLAHLRVTTDRADDNVTVDGNLVGRSGSEIDLAPGEHRVFISRRDGPSKSLDILLRDNETRDLRIVLEEKKGISSWWFVGGGIVLAGAVTTAAVLAAQPTKFEGNTAGTLNPFVVTASRGVGR